MTVRSSADTDNFVGSKGGAGIAQWIISQMPAHRVYVEPFLGKGIVFRTKLPASVNVGIEADQHTILKYWSADGLRLCTPAPIDRFGTAGSYLIQGDCLSILPVLQLDSSALVYADPPYLNRAAGNRRYYGAEALTVESHERILSVLEALPCMVMLSGYQSELYCRRLKNWRVSRKWTVNRAGQRVEEWLWMNFPEPVFYHDTRFTGSDYTDRQRVKRKCERWKAKFLAMGPGERMAVYHALSSVVDGACQEA